MTAFPKPTKEVKQPKRINQRGKKFTEWESCKEPLEMAFKVAGYTGCVVGRYMNQFEEYQERMQKHRHWFFITWAHGDKRNNLKGDELLTLVAPACVDCHNFIEAMPREKMRAIVEGALASLRINPIEAVKKVGHYVPGKGFEWTI